MLQRPLFQELYDELFPSKGIVVPAFPRTTVEQNAARKRYPKLMRFRFPDVTEKDYPASFVKPKWGQYGADSEIQRIPLEGRWVLVDTTPKPDWDGADAYTDQLTKDLGLKTRFGVSSDDCTEKHFPATQKLLHAKEVRHMTAEEWNFLANVMNFLRTSRNMEFPDLGSTNSWEWCENRCGSVRRLRVGDCVHSGLANVDSCHPSVRRDRIAFRPVIVL